MSTFLTLASDFIERMSNPAYGIRVNEDHALRFATLLEAEGFGTTLQSEVAELTSARSLTAHGWLWLLTWARSQNFKLRDELLLDLANSWSSVFMQASVIDVATMNLRELRPLERIRSIEVFPGGDEERRIEPLPVHNIRDRFVRTLLQQVTSVSEADLAARQLRTERAEQTLVALLQINREATLQAASSLLHHPWRGQNTLLEFYRTLRDGLDPDTQRVWDVRLGGDLMNG